jgi:hypothetical protein
VNTFPAVVIIDTQGEVRWSAGGVQRPIDAATEHDAWPTRIRQEIERLQER